MDTVTISELREGLEGSKGQTVQLEDADPNELQLFIDNMPATIKGKSMNKVKLTVYCTWLLKHVIFNNISIYTLSDLGDLSNLIGSLSRTIQQYSPPSEWITCELSVFPIF